MIVKLQSHLYDSFPSHILMKKVIPYTKYEIESEANYTGLCL